MTMILGKLQPVTVSHPHFCPYCRRMVRKDAFYFPGQPRLFFDRQSCADSWSKTFADENGFPTWPGVEPAKEATTKTPNITTVIGWFKKVFQRGNSPEISE